MHRVTEDYAKKWWTDETVATLSDKKPDGPYLRARRQGSTLRKDGFAPLPKNGMQ